MAHFLKYIHMFSVIVSYIISTNGKIRNISRDPFGACSIFVFFLSVIHFTVVNFTSNSKTKYQTGLNNLKGRII